MLPLGKIGRVLKAPGFFAGFVRNRGKFVIRNLRPICDDPLTLRRHRSWRCNFGRTANIATRTCRRIQRRRAFAATSARSARTAPRNSIMYARIAGADLRRGRSVPHGNGGRAFQWPSAHRRTNAYTSHIVLKISQRIRSGCETFRRRGGEPRDRSGLFSLPSKGGGLGSANPYPMILSRFARSRKPTSPFQGEVTFASQSAGRIVPSTSPKPTR